MADAKGKARRAVEAAQAKFERDQEAARKDRRKAFADAQSEGLTQKRPTKYNAFDYESVRGVYTFPPQYLPSGWTDQEDMPETFEMQVRTLFQHAYAEPQHNLGYKPGAELTEDVRRELAWIAASSWGADHALERVRKTLLEAA